MELLYRRDLERFVRAASAIVGDDALAHDAVHDAFVSAVRARTSFRGGSLEGWVWRIVVNAATEIRRSQREDLLSATSLTSTIARVATVLDIEVGTVSATLAAAHLTLRRALQEVRT